jgi:hypothetical protein
MRSEPPGDEATSLSGKTTNGKGMNGYGLSKIIDEFSGVWAVEIGNKSDVG